jgi:hypothetical protein
MQLFSARLHYRDKARNVAPDWEINVGADSILTILGSVALVVG